MTVHLVPASSFLAPHRNSSGRWQRSARTIALTMLVCGGLLGACTMPNGGSANAGSGTDENLAQKVDRLERELANLRIDYSIVRPAMERIVSSETGLEARLAAIESAFGPITASISPAASSTPAYVSPASTSFPRVGIHLASYRNQENVERGWAELQAAQSDILSGLQLNIVDYRSDHDGLYRRMVAGPLDPASAESRCASLKDRGIWCQVVTLQR